MRKVHHNVKGNFIGRTWPTKFHEWEILLGLCLKYAVREVMMPSATIPG